MSESEPNKNCFITAAFSHFEDIIPTDVVGWDMEARNTAEEISELIKENLDEGIYEDENIVVVYQLVEIGRQVVRTKSYLESA